MPVAKLINDVDEITELHKPFNKKLNKLIPRTKPKNETYEHWFCKIVGQAILWERFDCKYIGMEIDSMYHMDTDVGLDYHAKKKTGRQHWDGVS